MDRMPLVAVFFISIPEEIMLTALGLLLFGIKPPLKKLIFIGVIQAIISYLVRMLPIVFGVHTLLQGLLFTVVIWLILKIPFRVALAAMLVSISIYTVIDATIVPILLETTGISLETILASAKLRILFFLPQGAAMLLIVLLVYYFDFKLIDYNNTIKYHNYEEGKDG
ncbi:hypothetical protein [Desulfitibacter alkalitolerans]|uniref:hypothetical protein n=1 Tax=Desulfitibacter alkalitolerans TaxID=264641 RepID=UPI000684B34E|nr:hypothetical protein [Desulfitibacter alkalitolerans]